MEVHLTGFKVIWGQVSRKGVRTMLCIAKKRIITGQADLEKDWDAYITALYDMGLQDVIDVYQAALDRYNAR